MNVASTDKPRHWSAITLELTLVGLLVVQLAAVVLAFDWVRWLLNPPNESRTLGLRPVAHLAPSAGTRIGLNHNAARILRKGEFAWQDPHPSEPTPLESRDAVQTRETGEAEIVFDTGLALRLGPNAWIEILPNETTKRGRKLRLVRGRVQITQPDPEGLDVELGAKRIRFQPSTTAVVSETELEIKKGQAEVVFASGSESEKNEARTTPALRSTWLNTSERVRFDADRVQFHQPSFHFARPFEGDLFEMNSGDDLEISVQLNLRTSLRLEKPIEIDFSEIGPGGRRGRSFFVQKIPLPERLSKQMILKIRVPRSAVPQSKEKLQDFVLTARSQEEKVPIESDPLRIRVSRPILERPSVLPKSESFPPVQPSKKRAPPPPPDAFDIDVKKPAKKGNHSRLLNMGVTLWDYLIPPLMADEGSEESERVQVQVRWKPVPGISRYKIQVGSESTFQAKNKVESVTEAPEFEWSAESTEVGGTAYFRIASIGEDGEIGAFSQPQKVEIPPLRPPHLLSVLLDVSSGVSQLGQWGGASQLSQVWASPYFQNQLGLQGRIRLPVPGALVPRVHFSLARFHAPYGTPTTPQPSLTVATLWGHLNYTPQLKKHRTRFESEWGIFWDYGYRWEKLSPQVLEPRHSLSIGPSWVGVQKWRSGGVGWLPNSSEIALAAPLSGALTQGQMGAYAQLSTQWILFQKSDFRILLRAQTEVFFRSFVTSGSPRTFQWSFWLSPSLSWGNLL